MLVLNFEVTGIPWADHHNVKLRVASSDVGEIIYSGASGPYAVERCAAAIVAKETMVRTTINVTDLDCVLWSFILKGLQLRLKPTIEAGCTESALAFITKRLKEARHYGQQLRSLRDRVC